MSVTKPKRVFGYLCPKANDLPAGVEALVQRCRTYLDRLSQRPGSPDFQWADIATDSADQRETPLLERPHGRHLDATLQRGDMVIFAAMNRSASSVPNLIDIVARWRSRGVAVHFADDALAEATLDLSAEELEQQQELTLAVLKAFTQLADETEMVGPGKGQDNES